MQINLGNNMVIVHFGEVPFLAKFRYQRQWCDRISNYDYMIENGEVRTIPEMKTLVAIHINNIPLWKRRFLDHPEI
jgi:hypothetical protein